MKYLILGFGITGKSCARFLLDKGHIVTVFDDKLHASLIEKYQVIYPQISFEKTLKKENLLDFDFIVPSPGISPDHYLVKYSINKNLQIITDLDIFAANTRAKYILVTGTNGKSTVVSLLSKMLDAAGKKVTLGGNIGVPVLDCLDFDWVVIEVSSFTLYYTKLVKAEAGVLLNIADDHLNWHGDFSNYLSAKLKVYDFSLHKIFNSSHNFKKKEKGVTFGKKLGVDWLISASGDIINNNKIVVTNKDYLVSQAGLSENIAACGAIMSSLGFSNDFVLKGIRAFGGLDFRCQLVSRYNNIIWINDSKATNLHAVTAAIKSVNSQYGNDVFLIMTGLLKEYVLDLDVIIKNTKLIILAGDIARKISPLLKEKSCNYKIVNNIKEAVYLADSIVAKPKVVLFSPGGSSFDAFESYIQRGNHFNFLVKEMEGVL